MRKLPSVIRIVRLKAGCCLILRYTILEEEMPCGLIRYGVQITEMGATESITVRDLTTNFARVCNLLKVLVRCAITPVGLMDMLADWL